jgi:phosphoglycolate phosphatase-like HAD superfamily hydrolase
MLPCPAVKLTHATLIAFDNDGTLYPSGEQVGNAVLLAHREYVALRGLDIATPDAAWVRQMMGADAKEFYAAMLPGMPVEMQRDFEEFCIDHETIAVQRYPDLYPGAQRLLSDLHSRSKTMVLVTNGSPRYVQSVWDVAGLGRYLVAKYPYAPPEFASKGERLAQAMQEWGAARNGDAPLSVMVGDRASDVTAARNAGAICVGCAYGYGARSELDGADFVVENVDELYNLLVPAQED